MKSCDSLHVVGMAALFLAAAMPSDAQSLSVLTLISPNEEPSGEFGHSVSGAGDVNRDGVADVIVGAPQEGQEPSPMSAGRAYLFSGLDGSLLFELKSPNEDFQGHFGFSVSCAGDVNQDGSADVIVGALSEDGAILTLVGHAYVFSGLDGSILFELQSPNEESSGFFGRSVADAGDVNRDGFADVIVGSTEDPGSSPDRAGRAYVFSGQDGSLLFELQSPNEEWTVALAIPSPALAT